MTPYGEECSASGPGDVFEAAAAFAGVRAGEPRTDASRPLRAGWRRPPRWGCTASCCGTAESARRGWSCRRRVDRPGRSRRPNGARVDRCGPYFDASAIQRFSDEPVALRDRQMVDVHHGWMGTVRGDRPGLWVSAVLTEVLQRRQEPEVWQLPQAALLALSVHPEWRRASLDWLAPLRDTWLADNLAGRPQLAALARFVAVDAPWVPSWLAAPDGSGWAAAVGLHPSGGNTNRILPSRTTIAGDGLEEARLHTLRPGDARPAMGALSLVGARIAMRNECPN